MHTTLLPFGKRRVFTRWRFSLAMVVVCLGLGGRVHGAETRQVGISLPGGAEHTAVRKALVVGNKDYVLHPLVNTVYDAQAVAQQLASVGFEVTDRYNMDTRGMQDAVERYLATLKPGDVSFVYYSGHGMQIEGENYLIPVNFQATRAEDVKWNSYPLGRLMDGLQARNLQVSVVVLDACRDNPFKSTRSGSMGLASLSAGKGTLIAFATAPGSVAGDGDPGRHGVFTEVLLKHLASPGRDIEDMFKEVRREVAQLSNEEQVPWTSSSMIGQFMLMPPVSSTHQGDARPQLQWATIPEGLLEPGCVAGDRACQEDERPGDPVPVRSFSMLTHEVTAAQYQACVQAKACTPAGTARPTCNHGRRPDHPINCVDWLQAKAFCAWVGGRLPTPGEWEWAAKDGGKNIHPWRSPDVRHEHAHYGSKDGTAPVGGHPAGAGSFGVHDLLGNVWEWTDGDYPGGGKEARGGGWYFDAPQLRASNRMRAAATDRDAGIGFRCVRQR